MTKKPANKKTPGSTDADSQPASATETISVLDTQAAPPVEPPISIPPSAVPPKLPQFSPIGTPKSVLVVSGIILAILVVASGWYLWQKNRNDGQFVDSQASLTEALNEEEGTEVDGLVNYCAEGGTAWCKFFHAKYLVELSYPPGWAISGEAGPAQNDEATDSGTPVYTISTGTKGAFSNQGKAGFIDVNVYAGSLDDVKSNRLQLLQDSKIDVKESVSVIKGREAVRLEYKAPEFATEQAVSSYLIAANNYVYEYKFLLKQDANQVPAKTSDEIFKAMSFVGQ